MTIPLKLTGDLSIRGIDAAHQMLVEALKSEGGILISTADDAVADLTLVQLLESGRKAARDAGRDFRLAAPASGALLEMLRRGGFLESPGDRDFWLMESGN